ncbi:MAG: TRAP transporter fused permease subunit [Pseudomonadota bacterium]|nr:TRAP transporter fused permease subunit [Pseudomonadota bacterium]
MVDTAVNHSTNEAVDADEILRNVEAGRLNPGPLAIKLISGLALVWSLFQLWIASPFPFLINFGIIVDVPARGIHLAFALLLCFIVFPATKRSKTTNFPIFDLLLGFMAAFCALYPMIAQEGITNRVGVLLVPEIWGVKVPIEAIIGGTGILLLLEATRRAIGWPLVIVCLTFLVFSIFGQSMPEIISHKGVSIERLIGYQWLTGEGIFGIPLDVSVSFVFLFVLFGSLLEKAGAGKYFLDLAFAMVGRYRGGPAKAAILASGMSGVISGSSIANVVTTGTFTIPVMKKTGIPAVKAGAIEVAASTNGQIMPPIMGAAAFIIAETIGIPYFDVVVAAFIPAVISYMALLYISHLEALKLGLRGLDYSDVPIFWATFKQGLHFLAPIIILVYLLMVARWTAGSAVFYSIVVMMLIILGQRVIIGRYQGQPVLQSILVAIRDIRDGLITGAKNMTGIAVAVAAAGIIVGAVSSTGLNNAMVGVVEALSGGNVYILLLLTAVLCIVLGMGLPTTANYLVVASLLAGVLVELGNASGIVLPLIAVHLFVFYFGLLADSTPPVCLAAFAASAISRADPLKTGVQSFFYDIRTAILPFVFIFNTELLLIGVTSIWHGIMIFCVSLLAILSFSSLTQQWMFTRLKWFESALLIIVIVGLFRPDFLLDRVYPAFASADIKRAVKGELAIDNGITFRIHVVRETDYGDRFKLFLLKSSGTPGLNSYGLELGEIKNGRYPVTNVAFNSVAEKAGIRPYEDYVTDIDVEQRGRPAKEWIYLLALMVLGLAVSSQLGRRRLQTQQN